VITYQATNENNEFTKIIVEHELELRKKRVQQFLSLLQLETPDSILNTFFAFAKIRNGEHL
jgi:hypothetical protein